MNINLQVLDVLSKAQKKELINELYEGILRAVSELDYSEVAQSMVDSVTKELIESELLYEDFDVSELTRTVEKYLAKTMKQKLK